MRSLTRKNRGASAPGKGFFSAAVFGAILMAAGMAGTGAVPQELPGPPASDQGSNAPALRPLPEVSLEELSPDVRAQLREARDVVEQSLQSPKGSPADLAEDFGLLGQLYHAYDLGQAARVCYRNALALAPSTFEWNYYLGSLLAKEGELAEAIELLTRAETQRPDDLAVQVRLGNAHLQNGQLPEAKSRFLRAMAIDSNSAAAAFGLGQVALSNREYADAVGLLQKTLALAPGANAVHYPLGLAYRSLGLKEQAAEHLALQGSVGVVVADPLMDRLKSLKRGEIVFLLRGREAFQAGRFTEAAELFLKAVAAAPESARARINTSAALASMRDFEGAERQLRVALELEPENATVQFNLGSLLLARGQPAQARSFLEKAIELKPRDDQAHVLLGRALLQTDQGGSAMSEFREGLRLNKANEEARMEIARLLVDERRFEEAKALLEEANREFPFDGRTAHALARMLAACPDPKLRDGEAALPLALSVFEARNSVGHARTVAMAYAEMGECGKAAEWLGSILEAVSGAEGLAPDLAGDLRAELARYRQGAPCRPPFETP